jgi:dienelactone hydrolase
VTDSSDRPRSPLELLDAIAKQEAEVGPDVWHVEIYTMRGLLTLLWHGPRDASGVVLMGGGAAGGLLGPASGLYHDLGRRFTDLGIGTIRVGYRRPNDLPRCTHDLVAAADLASRTGARRFVTVGHSFGGAVAVQAGIALGDHCAGVVTLATQSAGCEQAARLGATPLLLLHGDRDELLPPDASFMVQALAGHGDVEILPGAGHLLAEAHDELRGRLAEWIPARFAG